MMDENLYDPYEKAARRSSKGIPPLNDPADREDPDRPLRTEDLIPRHGGNKQPKIWLPDGSGMAYYGRPSSWGGVADDEERLGKWDTRKTVEGYLDYGRQSATLRLERAALPPPDEDREAHNRLNERAKAVAFDKDRVGTAKHKLTENHDLGVPMNIFDDEDMADLMEWIRLTKFMEIVTLPNGSPAIECFVVLDAPRLDQYLQPVKDSFGRETGEMVRLAGTFDRIFRYLPCPICGKENYAADFKSSGATGIEFGQRKNGIQVGVYSRSMLYYPWPDGKGADRVPLPDLCLHRGIIVSVPAGTGQGTMQWIDIVKGYNTAVSLIPSIREHQAGKNWMREFTPVPNLRVEIDRCDSVAEVRALWKQYPGPEWEADDNALVLYASARIETLGATK